MKIKLLLISFLLAANSLGATAQVSKTYYVSKPGTLISMMTEDEANAVTHLTLTGKLNAFMGCDNLRYVLATGDKITTLGDSLFGDGVPSKLVYKK